MKKVTALLAALLISTAAGAAEQPVPRPAHHTEGQCYALPTAGAVICFGAIGDALSITEE